MNAEIKQAYLAKQKLTGKIVKEVRGGFEVNIHDQRCFLPSSHIHIALIDPRNQKNILGQFYNFIIAKMDQEDIIVTRTFTMEEHCLLVIPQKRELLFEEEKFLSFSTIFAD